MWLLIVLAAIAFTLLTVVAPAMRSSQISRQEERNDAK